MTKVSKSKKKVVVKGHHSLSAEVIQVSPGAARELLKTNRKNRHLLASRVAKLADAMRRGEWVVAQPIMLNDEGRLIDGQHRLHAVVDSGKTVEMLVIRGYDIDETFAKIDDTATRSLKAWLEIQGEARPSLLAAVIRMHFAFLNGRNPFAIGGGIGGSLTGPTGLEVLEQFPDLRNSVTEGRGILNTLLPPGMCAYMHYRFSKVDALLANTFFVDLIQGDYAGDGDPVYMLRQRLLSNKAAKEKLPKVMLAALTIKAWNAYAANEPLLNLKWQTAPTSDNRTPERFPEIRGEWNDG